MSSVLREHISKYLYHARRVHSSPDQIIIGAGTQPLLWLLLQLLGSKKNTESKTLDFHRIPAMIQSSGLPVHPIPLDDKGNSYFCFT